MQIFFTYGDDHITLTNPERIRLNGRQTCQPGLMNYISVFMQYCARLEDKAFYEQHIFFTYSGYLPLSVMYRVLVITSSDYICLQLFYKNYLKPFVKTGLW